MIVILLTRKINLKLPIIPVLWNLLELPNITNLESNSSQAAPDSFSIPSGELEEQRNEATVPVNTNTGCLFLFPPTPRQVTAETI